MRTMRCWVALLLWNLFSSAVGQEITGKIVTCAGCRLNRLHELRSFLKDREAEYYHGVEVEYLRGRDAVLTIYQDGMERETVILSDIPTKEELHEVMLEKGFQRKSNDEIMQIKAELYWRREEEKVETLKRNSEIISRHKKIVEEQRKAKQKVLEFPEQKVLEFPEQKVLEFSVHDEL